MVGEEVEVVAGARDHRVRHRAQEGAVVAGLDLRDLRGSLLDQLADPVEDLGAPLGRHRAPGLEALLGGVDGLLGLVRAASGDLGDRRLIDRGDVREGRGGSQLARHRSNARSRPRLPRPRRVRSVPSPPSLVVRARTVWRRWRLCQHGPRRAQVDDADRATELEHPWTDPRRPSSSSPSWSGDVPVWLVIVIFAWIEVTMDAFAWTFLGPSACSSGR